MLSKFWLKDTRQIKDILDDTIHNLTTLSDLLGNMYRYHNNIDNLQLTEETSESNISLDFNS